MKLRLSPQRTTRIPAEAILPALAPAVILQRVEPLKPEHGEVLYGYADPDVLDYVRRHVMAEGTWERHGDELRHPCLHTPDGTLASGLARGGVITVVGADGRPSCYLRTVDWWPDGALEHEAPGNEVVLGLGDDADEADDGNSEYALGDATDDVEVDAFIDDADDYEDDDAEAPTAAT
jgi:hypothetical protein